MVCQQVQLNRSPPGRGLQGHPLQALQDRNRTSSAERIGDSRLTACFSLSTSERLEGDPGLDERFDEHTGARRKAFAFTGG